MTVLRAACTLAGAELIVLSTFARAASAWVKKLPIDCLAAAIFPDSMADSNAPESFEILACSPASEVQKLLSGLTPVLAGAVVAEPDAALVVGAADVEGDGEPHAAKPSAPARTHPPNHARCVII